MVCTNTEAHADMIENGKNGFLFEREKPHQLAQLVNRLLSDPALCRTIGMRARRTIEQRFTSEICATETVKYYKEAMSQSTASV
jgi:glycosyltransferase involved in cell wall biosynthesis